MAANYLDFVRQLLSSDNQVRDSAEHVLETEIKGKQNATEQAIGGLFQIVLTDQPIEVSLIIILIIVGVAVVVSTIIIFVASFSLSH